MLLKKKIYLLLCIFIIFKCFPFLNNNILLILYSKTVYFSKHFDTNKKKIEFRNSIFGVISLRVKFKGELSSGPTFW